LVWLLCLLRDFRELVPAFKMVIGNIHLGQMTSSGVAGPASI